MATKGMESILASMIPVIRLVAPGPEVAKHTPTSPVALAYPPAAKDPPCSCLGKTIRIFLDRVRPWWISMDAPPG